MIQTTQRRQGMKRLVEFELDDSTVFVEVEDMEESDARRVGRSGHDKPDKAETRFTDAIARVRPAAEAVLNSFREMNTPDEIELEFGLKFNAKAGAVLASVDSESTFRVSLKWLNKK